jgi:Uma2 family endonuclease
MRGPFEAIEQAPLVVHTAPAMEMDDERFFSLCQQNPDLRLERTSKGDLIIMPPVGGSSSRRNAKLTTVFELWAERDGTGQIFDSSGGFKLPNCATRSPDVSWVRNKRLEALADEELEKFLPLCPDFVLELRSPSDRLEAIQEKMREYVENGARLGWLLDPLTRQVYIYHPRRSPELLDNPKKISGEAVLKGFVLDVPKIWAAIKRKGS